MGDGGLAKKENGEEITCNPLDQKGKKKKGGWP